MRRRVEVWNFAGGRIELVRTHPLGHAQPYIPGAGLEQLHVLAVATLTGLLLDLGLDPVRHFLLSLPAVHPIRFLILEMAGDFKGAARFTDGTLLVALFATKATGPAAGVGADLGGHEIAQHRHDGGYCAMRIDEMVLVLVSRVD